MLNLFRAPHRTSRQDKERREAEHALLVTEATQQRLEQRIANIEAERRVVARELPRPHDDAV